MAYNSNTMSFEVPDTDMVYVSGLPLDTTEAAIAQHFGSIGVLKQDKKKGGPKIWLYRDKATGGLKVLSLCSGFWRPAFGLSCLSNPCRVAFTARPPFVLPQMHP